MKKNQKFELIANEIIKNVGGKDNISDAFHCMTRLRLILKDQSLIENEKIKNTNGVMGTSFNAGQYQVILGNDVYKIYTVLIDILGLNKNEPIPDNKTEKTRIL